MHIHIHSFPPHTSSTECCTQCPIPCISLTHTRAHTHTQDITDIVPTQDFPDLYSPAEHSFNEPVPS